MPLLPLNALSDSVSVAVLRILSNESGTVFAKFRRRLIFLATNISALSRAGTMRKSGVAMEETSNRLWRKHLRIRWGDGLPGRRLRLRCLFASVWLCCWYAYSTRQPRLDQQTLSFWSNILCVDLNYWVVRDRVCDLRFSHKQARRNEV